MVSALAAWAGTRPGAESADALASMYADLSGQRASDPAAFRARVAWWSATLREACWQNVDGAGSPLVLALDDAAPTRWAREDAGRPVCLSVVVVRLMLLTAGDARGAPAGDVRKRVHAAHGAARGARLGACVARLGRAPSRELVGGRRGR